jgi:5-methyltetrahydrofolate--homocysteine methyltransferase
MSTTSDVITPRLQELLSDRILLIDGSMGALLMSKGLVDADYRGRRFADHPIDLKNATDILCLTQPDLIAGIHRDYLEAGADIIETNTFQGNVVTLKEFGLEHLTREVNRVAVELAKREADVLTRKNPAKPRFVAGSIGPTNVLPASAESRSTRWSSRMPNRSGAFWTGGSTSCCRKRRSTRST